jgi:hypothetical protein
MGVICKERVKKEFTVLVTYVPIEGPEEVKELTFSADTRDWKFAQEVRAAIALSEKPGLESYDCVKRLFDALAPGQWDTWLDFIHGDSIYMSMITAEMGKVFIESTVEMRKQDALGDA